MADFSLTSSLLDPCYDKSPEGYRRKPADRYDPNDFDASDWTNLSRSLAEKSRRGVKALRTRLDSDRDEHDWEVACMIVCHHLAVSPKRGGRYSKRANTIVREFAKLIAKELRSEDEQLSLAAERAIRFLIRMAEKRQT